MRWQFVTVLAALLLSATVTVILLPRPAWAADPGIGDPWYDDVFGHWAEKYIRVLWEEGVTDGWVHNGSHKRFSVYRPEDFVTRAEFTVMAAKVFRLDPYEKKEPSFADLPAGYLIYGSKRAYPYVEAAYRRGLVFGTGNGMFQPGSSLSRQQAVAILVRSLGLFPYAVGLPPEEVGLLLSRFSDASLVDPAHRHELAAAVKLKLVQGYPDGSVRPRAMLRRSEAATLVYRSCLVVVEANPNPFSPDNDGFEDSTVFTLGTLKNRNLTDWGLEVTTYNGQPVKSWGSSSRTPAPPSAIPWDGSLQNGVFLMAGDYYYRAWVKDRYGQLFTSTTMPLTVEKRTLEGYLYPSVVAPGDAISVRCTTSGRASEVKVTWPWGEDLPLNPSGSTGNAVNQWFGRYQVPSNWEDGAYSARLRASFGGTDREISLAFRVLNPWQINGQVVPNPAMAGQLVSLSAQANFSPDRVTAAVPGQSSAEMLPLGNGRWEYSFIIPLQTPEGSYDLLVTGYKGSKSKSTTVKLVVKGNILETLNFIISD